MRVLLRSLDGLVDALRGQGYRVIGPTVRDDAIVLSELESADALPHGWGVRTEAGGYRLRRRDDRAAFSHSTGPQSWKSFLHPSRSRLFAVQRDGADLTVTEPAEPEPRYAFLGVRPCDLRAIAVQDRVLSGPHGGYARRRAAALLIAVECTEPAETCFCSSVGCGPAADAGYDIALNELVDGDRVSYLARSGSPAGEVVLAGLDSAPAAPELVERAGAEVTSAAGRMVRSLPGGDLRDLLAGSLEATRWEDVAQRCLACGNCTMVCPTCFCTTVEDTTDLAGEHAERWLRWDSCFDLDFSYLHGGPVRSSTRSRYRQWLTHKLGTWHDQFGESGCVGCGRCIAWCPVGIDITEETSALLAERDSALPAERNSVLAAERVGAEQGPGRSTVDGGV